MLRHYIAILRERSYSLVRDTQLRCSRFYCVHNMPIHNILSTRPKLSISQNALGTLPEDGNVMPKHVEATIYNL
jgi:hypothetical protein